MPARANQLAWLVDHPEACVHAVQAARGIPPIDLATLEPTDPPTIRILFDGHLGTLQPDLAWFVRFGPERQRALLLVDAVQRFDPTRVGTWPRLRAGVRLRFRCPTWMLVHVSQPSLIAAIEAGFTHQRELMPILMRPEFGRPDLGQAPRNSPSAATEPQFVERPRPRLLALDRSSP